MAYSEGSGVPRVRVHQARNRKRPPLRPSGVLIDRDTSGAAPGHETHSLVKTSTTGALISVSKERQTNDWPPRPAAHIAVMLQPWSPPPTEGTRPRFLQRARSVAAISLTFSLLSAIHSGPGRTVGHRAGGTFAAISQHLTSIEPHLVSPDAEHRNTARQTTTQMRYVHANVRALSKLITRLSGGCRLRLLLWPANTSKLLMSRDTRRNIESKRKSCS